MADTSKQPVVTKTFSDEERIAGIISSMNLWQKLAAITGDVGAIAKDGKNKEQSYSFIEYGAVAARLRDLYAKYHVDFTPSMGERVEKEITSKYGQKGVNVVIRFKFTFTNADKPDEKQEVDWEGEASDYGDKATNKAATAAAKYFQMRKFNVSEKGDEDPDSETPAPVEHVEPRKLSPQMTKTKISAELTKISAELTKMGFDADQRKQIVYGIADVDMDSTLTPGTLNHVLGVINAAEPDDLRILLEADDPKEPES